MANKKYEALALKEAVNKAKKELEKRVIKVEFINTKEGALKRLKELIPKNSEVMIGGSTTLEQIGFVNLLKSKNHPWVNLKDKILAEKDKNKQNEYRRKFKKGIFRGKPGKQKIHCICNESNGRRHA